jgi:purine nucleosidase
VSERRRVALDTDLGSDVDDALALALLIGSPEVDLAGVTTVYGDTLLRARATSRLLALAGVEGVPVRPGARAPLSGAEVWWAGHEGTLMGDLSTATTTPVEADTDAADWLAAQAAAAPGELDVLCIGPLTNIALALRRSPGFARDVRRLWIMGGRFDGALDEAGHLEGEHNLRSDAVAAREVLTSGAPITITGLEITTQVHLEAEAVTAIGAAGPAGQVLAAQVRQWWEYWKEPWGVPHDPVAALAMLRPDLVVAGEDGTVAVEEGPPNPGAARHTPDGTGTVQVAVTVAPALTATEVRDRVIAGCTRHLR